MKTVRTDVLVVGAGPAGLSASALLAEYGVEAITVTKFPATSPTPRAHITNQRTVEIFRELGIEDEVRAIALTQDQMGTNVWAASFAGVELARLNTWGTGLDRRADYAQASPCEMCNAPQHVLEPVLLSAARDRNADIRFDTELIAIVQDADSVRATVRTRATGETYCVEAKYVIGADGGRSSVAELLGFELEGESLGHALSVWLEADLTKYVAHRPGALFWVSPPGTDVLFSPWTVIVPHTEWTTLFLLRDFAEPNVRDDVVLELVRASIGDPDVEVKIKSISPWRINHIVARDYQKGRVFLAGDAAHRHPPSNGLGSNTSIQDSYNLAWKLAMVLRGSAGPQLLDTYSSERQPVGRQVVDRAIKSLGDLDALAKALGLTSSDTADERWRSYAELFSATAVGANRRSELLEAVDLVNWQLNCHGVELGQRYTSAAVITDGTRPPEYTRDPELYYHPTTYPGAYLPHVSLQHGTSYISTIDLAGKGKFTIFTGVDGAAWAEATAKVAAELGIEIGCVTIGMRAQYDDVLGEWTRIREFDDSGCLLIRPDRHVAWRSASAVEDPTRTLRAVLESVLARPGLEPKPS